MEKIYLHSYLDVCYSCIYFKAIIDYKLAEMDEHTNTLILGNTW